MRTTRSQMKRRSTTSRTRADDAPDLFEPTATTHLGASSRPTSNAPGKRPAVPVTSSSQPPSATKKQRSNARRKVTIPTSKSTLSKKNDTRSSSSEPFASDDENSTTAGIAKVTPAAVRVRPHPLTIANVRPRLPNNVVDIFDTTTGRTDTPDGSNPGRWETAEESMRNYVTGFLGTYGPEYYRQIIAQEEQECMDTMAMCHTRGESYAILEQFRMTDPLVEFETLLPFQPLLTVKMRHVLVSWLAEVTAEFKLSQCAYHLAVSLLDKLLLMGPTKKEYKAEQEKSSGFVSDDEDDDDDVDDHFLIKPRIFQAVGCACIWIASKIEDRTPPTSEQLNFISDNACSAEALIQLEARILELFKFRPLRITPLHFLDIHERASQASTALIARREIHQHNPQFHHMIQYILQLGCSNYQLSHEKPSLVAAAACFLTRATLGLRSSANDSTGAPAMIWTPTLEFYSGYPLEALSRIVVLLLMSYMEGEKLNNALFTIYRQHERYRVSLKTAPCIEFLDLPGVPTECGTHEKIVEMIVERKAAFLDESRDGNEG